MPPAPRKLTIEDLTALHWIADPQISPDGSRVAFTRVWVDAEADEYRTAIWRVNADGAGLRRLTSGERDSQPRWSPDGTRLAFVRAPEAEKPGQLMVLPMEGGEAVQRTKLEKSASEPAWSPDGRRIAFTSRTNPALDDPEKKKPKHEPGRLVTQPVWRWNEQGFLDPDHLPHLWVIDAAEGEPRQVTTGRFAEAAPRWSRDGRHLLFLSDRRDQPWFGRDRLWLYRVAADLEAPEGGARLEPLTEMDGTVSAFREGAGGRIAMTGCLFGERVLSYDQPGLLLGAPAPAGDGAKALSVRPISARADFPFGEGVSADQHPPRGGGEIPLGFGPGGDAVIAMMAKHGSALLVSAPLAGGEITELTPAGRDLIAGTGSADGRRWALTIGDWTRPGDLHLLDVASRKLTKLCSPNDGLLEETKLAGLEEFWYPSFDGARIQAWLVKPPDFDPAKKYPLILAIHGGPHVPYGFSFFHEFQVFAAAGFVVLFTNPRGSTSYGSEFANVIQYHYPGDDYRDLMIGVDEVLKRGFVDAKRLGVCGGSGGGLLTNWIVTQTERFAAAVTDRCVADWASMYYSSDFALFNESWFRKPPFEDPAEHAERSPVTFAARITTPLFIVHSEDDWRTPIGQGETMFRALKQQKKKTAMVRFPGENHELSRSGTPSRRVQRLSLYRRWFGRFLLGESAPEFDEPFQRAEAPANVPAAAPAAAPARAPRAGKPRRQAARPRQRPLARGGARRRG
ncbi:MAG TPA: S9 family peptidase [Candidatus Eisenbacteria bacterium]|jgi:dipeptidyl aminopeptidase/acylaminoacyl peptidase